MLTKLALTFSTLFQITLLSPLTINNNNDIFPSFKQGTLSSERNTIVIGSCKIVINELCPDPQVAFFLFSKTHPEIPEGVRIGSDSLVSNLSSTAFNPAKPSKIIIHGYNSGMDLNVLVELKKQYVTNTDYNIFMVDWSALSQGPCYPAAVWNIRHVGKCTAQLVERIKEAGSENIHLVGFSLGAQVTNYVANEILPFKLPRITGLDPAGPGFLTATSENKLDKSDAKFVDIIHTNAFVQGIFEESGHVDFFLNGGVIQPGCWAETRFFACNHHRAPLYFAESISTEEGFYGWPCPSYAAYILGQCPPKDPQIIMGEHIKHSSSGVHLVITDSVAPFAVGKFTGPAIEILLKSELQRRKLLREYQKEIMKFMDEDDIVESLRVSFNASEIHQIAGNYFADDEPSVDLIFR